MPLRARPAKSPCLLLYGDSGKVMLPMGRGMGFLRRCV